MARKTTGHGKGAQLMVTVPPETLRALKVKAVERSSTVRALVLRALRRAGYPVPEEELQDRRRKG